MKPLSDDLLVGRNRSRNYTLWAVILLAVALRAAVMARGGNLFEDPDNYLPLAQTLASGDGFQVNGRPTAYRPPLYPIMLAPFVSLGSESSMLLVAGLHLVLGGVTVWLTALATKGSGLSRARVGLAALLVACDPVLVWQSRAVMTETPAAFLTALSLAMLCLRGWRGPLFGGAGLGLAALCRPSLLPGALLIAVAASLVKPGEPRARLARGGLVVLGLVLVISPWTIRNLIVFREPVWMTTHGGYTLALANNPVYYDDILNGPPGRVWTGALQWEWWRSVQDATNGMSEPQADRFMREQVWKLVQARPRDFIKSTLVRLGHFWGVYPAASVYSASVRIAVMVWTVPFWILLALGLFDPGLWRWPRIAAPLAAIGLTIIHLFFWTDLRMRAPIVPALALIAAGAHAAIFRRKALVADGRLANFGR